MQVLRDHESSINNPEIMSFIDAFEKSTDDGIISIPLVQSSALIKFSKSIMIAEWHPEKDDFKFRYCGSNITTNYGMDITGKYISETMDSDLKPFFVELYTEIIKEQKRIYLTGTLEPRGKGFMNWYQVSIPLIRDGKINEVLSFVSVSPRN